MNTCFGIIKINLALNKWKSIQPDFFFVYLNIFLYNTYLILIFLIIFYLFFLLVNIIYDFW